MPELPEVETMRRGIAAIAGSRIAGVRRVRSRLRPIQIKPSFAALCRRATGRTVASVGRAGKRLILELDSGDRIVLEPRMTGRVLLAEPPGREHLRLVFDLDGGPHRQLLFWDMRGLGVVHVVSPEESHRLLGSEKLGPDALEISRRELHQHLSPSRRAVKVALLDQRAVAGIGNIYASEILHRARLHPETPCQRLTPAAWDRLHASIVDVLSAAVQHKGSTLRDGNFRDAGNEAGGYQTLHAVYGRAGQACRRCGRAKIRRIVQAQRSTFYCPRCQRRCSRG